MLSDLNRSLLLYILIAVIGIVALVIVVSTVITLIKSYKKGDLIKRKVIAVTLTCIAVAAASWIFNMGWIRFIMTLLLIPFIHAIIFFLVNIFSSKYLLKSKKTKHIYIIFCITYLLFYLLLPDGGDVGEMYVFFGLIHSNTISNICNSISSFAILAHIILLILQIAEIIKIRKATK